MKKIGTVVLLFMFLFNTVIPVRADSGEKKLYFEQKHGEMVWDARKGSDGNWFMSFTNMVPGESYQDKLLIENGSSKNYELFFQIVPVKQTELKDELLKKIEMTVTQDGKQIYKGKASGEAGTKNLQEVVPLGMYKSSEESTLVVDLTLDADVGLEYNALLTKIDWKFMVREKPDAPLKEIKPPKTGDHANIEKWFIILLVSLIVLGVPAVLERKHAFHKQGRGDR